MKTPSIAIILSVTTLLATPSLVGSTEAKNNADKQAHDINLWPSLTMPVKQNQQDELKIQQLLAQMSIEQKVAQLIQPQIRDITVEDMRRYGFGSYLNGGGGFPNNDKHASVEDWVNLAENLYQASRDDSLDGIDIPTMWGTDAVHGHNNVMGATLFPHNIGLGAANNPKLIEQIASITATEVMVTGIDWVFAPTVAVVRDDRWGRSYEGYSEDPEIVRDYSAAIVKGLQGAADKDFLGQTRVISSVKHFLGDGGTQNGDDQGNNLSSEQELFRIHAQGYVGGLEAGAQTVMASFNSWHGVKSHGNTYLLTDVLKEKMGFDGFVVGDWNGHGQIPGCTKANCSKAINAGLDVYMVPSKDWKPLYENLILQVKQGEIPMARLNDAVSRVLRVKMRADLFNKPSPANRLVAKKVELIGHPLHRKVARQAVRESLVLLKNNNQILPLKPNQRILVAGDGADNIGKQSGGWSVTWQGTGNVNADFPGATSIYAGIKAAVNKAGGQVELVEDGQFEQRPDVAIVVFGEDPYAEGVGDIDDLNFEPETKSSLALLKQLKSQGIPVVSIFISGRPMWVNAELNASDAFVATWLPGSEGAGIADVILREPDGDISHDFKGKLSFSWPKTAHQTNINRFDKHDQPLFAYGYGLTYRDNITLANNLDETYKEDTHSQAKMSILDGTIKPPFVSVIATASDYVEINSSVQALQNIQYKTIDRIVQEDSVSLSFTGKDKAEYRILSKQAIDLSAYAQVGALLNFYVELEQKPQSKVSLSMWCQQDENPTCRGDVDISKMLTSVAQKGWVEVSIPLSCFAKSGAKMTQISSPFALQTNGSARINLSEISISAPELISNKHVLNCR